MIPRPRSSAGRRVLDAALGLRAPLRIERSVKLVPGRLLTERFLASLPVGALGPDPSDGLGAIAARLGVPDRLRDDLFATLGACDNVHLGCEDGEDGSVCKLYLEFAGAARRARADGAAEPLVYLAAKWAPEHERGSALSRYVWRRGNGRGEVARALEDISGERHDSPSRALGLAALDRVGEGEVMLLEVKDDGHKRRSFDLNLYDAGLTVRDLDSPIAAAAEALGVDRGEAADVFGAVARESLGHIAGGVGRDGRDFATVYFGVTER